jgi:hypothetical protein
LTRRLIITVAAIAALAILYWYVLFRPRESPASRTERAPPAEVARAASGSASSAVRAATPADPYATDAPSHLADNLNDPAGDIHADLRILNDIFQQYRSALHSENPVGDNVDITAVLTGRNKLGFAFIPRDCPAINARGELCDRWGTPFFFHQLSGMQMEIRSAGPDRILWTSDDEVMTPGLRPPHL